MKKNYFYLIILLLLTSCHKEDIKISESPDQVNTTPASVSVKYAKELSKDKIFQAYVADSKAYFVTKKNVAKIKYLMSLPTLSQSDKEEFAIALGFSSSSKFETFAYTQNEKAKYLNSKYDLNRNPTKNIAEFVQQNLNPAVLQNISRDYTGGFSILTDNTLSVVDTGGGGGSNCGRHYANCLAIATSVAVAAHLACGAFDIASGGLTAYLCHGAAILGQAAMNDECVISYSECGVVTHN
jgi:hypothetical protein